jgi:hypothetical protein
MRRISSWVRNVMVSAVQRVERLGAVPDGLIIYLRALVILFFCVLIHFIN